MNKAMVSICASILLAGCATMGGQDAARELKVVSETSLKGFVFPESVGCDATQGVLYVSNFGGSKLAPAEKDGLGYVSKVAPDGRVIEQRAFGATMNKPKGIWIERGRLWVTDIDGVWIFDTRSRKGRKLAIPGIQFANDPAVVDNVLFVSDNRGDQVFRVDPADFLDAATQPRLSIALPKRDINPNGIWPSRQGSLLVAGFLAPDKPRGIHAIDKFGRIRSLGGPTGRLDGLHEMGDGSLLVTDWNTGSLLRWSEKGGTQTLAKGFKGPADFCVLGDTVYVPDLVTSEIRAIRLK